jgi:hypothetical protein
MVVSRRGVGLVSTTPEGIAARATQPPRRDAIRDSFVVRRTKSVTPAGACMCFIRSENHVYKQVSASLRFVAKSGAQVTRELPKLSLSDTLLTSAHPLPIPFTPDNEILCYQLPTQDYWVSEPDIASATTLS